jgi:8-amino-7-oxononanoate synthase
MAQFTVRVFVAVAPAIADVTEARIGRTQMDWNDPINQRIAELKDRYEFLRQRDWYHYLLPSQTLNGGSRVQVAGRELLMLASYSYLNLIAHPRIKAAAKAAIDEYSTGTHGVRLLAGSTRLHEQLEDRIASFKNREAAVTYSSGYTTNLSVISTLLGHNDLVFSDRLNHASIVDGCRLSSAHFVRFKHRDMDDLKAKLEQAPGSVAKLVVIDAVFSMDGDVTDLPRVRELCDRYGAWLMVDEAHAVGVLGKGGHGIEEHFGMPGTIDICMGTLSKAIPSVGGYVAGSFDLINFLKHVSRAFIFSAALPPPAAAAAKEAFDVIEAEPERIAALQGNMYHFIEKLKARGFSTLDSETPVVPIICGSDDDACEMARLSRNEGIFIIPVVSPAVPDGTSRLRACVTVAHTREELDWAVDVFASAGHKVGIL